jgi:hypothetical protein
MCKQLRATLVFATLFFTVHANASQLETATKLQEIVVSGAKTELPAPDEKVGSYNQPHWTASRSFTNTRAYVIPEGEVAAEFWVTQKVDRTSKANYFLIQKEFEVGLGGGLQLDIYQNDQKDFNSRNTQFEGMQYELRWALAKWGEILFNPTLYFEYHAIEVNPDRFEFRLLLADTFGAYHISSNLAYEIELWSPKTREMAVTLGVARNVNRAIAIGVESKAEGSDTEADRTTAWEYYAGPAIRWTPIHRFNVLLSTLIGMNDNSHLTESTLIVGLDF